MRSSELLSVEEIVRLAGIMARLGVDKVRLTGGEPLVRLGIEDIAAGIAAIPGITDLAITTNGLLLPQKARALKAAGVNRVNISLDSLDEGVFRDLNGNRGSVHDVLEGIAAAEAAGLTPIKLNMVVMRGVNDDGIVDLAAFCRSRGYVARFIEYMDAGTQNGWRLEQVVTAVEIVLRIDAVLPLEPVAGSHDQVANRFRFVEGSGEIGVIPSISQPFCSGCDRVRLSADGGIYTCLFARKGLPLRSLLRGGASDEEITGAIQSTWQQREDRYSELRTSASDLEQEARVQMHYIGG